MAILTYNIDLGIKGYKLYRFASIMRNHVNQRKKKKSKNEFYVVNTINSKLDNISFKYDVNKF